MKHKTKQSNDDLMDLPTANGFDYNEWFTFFQSKPAKLLIDSQNELESRLPAVGYAAFMRWLEIFDNPSKMEKIIKARVDEDSQNSLVDLATGDDDEAYYEGIIKAIAMQMNGSGTSPQEFARLAANMNIARKELRDIRSRRPKRGTKLEKVLKQLGEINSTPKKLPKEVATVKKSTKLKVVTKAAKKRPPRTSSKASKQAKMVSKSATKKTPVKIDDNSQIKEVDNGKA